VIEIEDVLVTAEIAVALEQAEAADVPGAEALVAHHGGVVERGARVSPPFSMRINSPSLSWTSGR